MNFNKLARAALAALLILSLALAGCGYNPESVMTIDGEAVPAGRWLYMQMSSISEAIDELDDVTVSGLDVLEHDIEGTPARDWVRDKTIESCKRYSFIEKEFERLGLAYETSELDSMQYNTQYTWDYYGLKDVYEANGISYDTFFAVYLNRMKETKVRDKLFAEGGEMAISAEDKQAYFDANFAQYEYFRLPQNDTVGFNMLESYPAEVHELAARMLEKAEADGIRAAYLELYSEALTLAQDTETVVDEASADTAVSSSTVAEALGYSEPLVSAVLSAPIGGYGTAEADGTVYIFRRVALLSDATAESYDDTIVAAIAEQPFEDYITEKTASLEVVPDDKALDYYSPDKVILPQQ